MAAELVWRALAICAVVFAIVWVFRRRGQRAAGLLAALPVLSAPALFTLSVDPNPAIATAGAVAGLHATGLTASLVLCYGIARRPLGAPLALLFGGLCALLVAHLSFRVGHDFAPAFALTLAVVGIARRYLPQLSPPGSMCPFLSGYLDGLLVRSAFLAVLAIGLAPLGGWLAFPLAMLAAVVVLLAITSLDQGGGVARGCACDAEGGSATTLAERS
ncbi:MAG: hypothetical protein ABI781_07770 [Burkholderiales bacterium]